jgi:hypothetical protein
MLPPSSRLFNLIQVDIGSNWQPTRLAFLSTIDRVVLAQTVRVAGSLEAMLSVRVMRLWYSRPVGQDLCYMALTASV